MKVLFLLLVAIATEGNDTVLLGEHALGLSEATLCVLTPQASADAEISYRKGPNH